MIKLLEKDGKTCPLLFCDICDKVIEKADDGEYLIPDTKEGELVAPIIGHYKCTKRFEDQEFAKDETMYGNQPLNLLFSYLFNNLKIDYEKSREQAAVMSNLDFI